MTQPTERRFVMEPRLDAEVATLNTAISAEATARANADALKADLTDPRFTDQRTPLDNSVTSAKIVDGAIVNADINNAAAIAFSKLALPTADVNVNTHKVINVVDPTNAQDAATKAYVDSLVASGATTGPRLVRVKAGTNITKGQPVYITGADGTNMIAGLAGNGSEATSSKTMGLMDSTVSNNGFGYIVSEGLLSGLNTAAAAAGDPVWLGPSGTLLFGLANKPVAPAHLVFIGIVTKANGSTGEIFIRPQNGFELDELHNVLITSPTNGQALTYETSSGLWKNATPVNALSGLSDVAISSPSGGQVIKYNAGTSKWVNGAAAGGVTAADTAPSLSTAAAGDAWFDTNDGTLYVCYVDVDSTKQWVQVQANSALEASILSRLGALESTAIAVGTLSPNYIINADMSINQRAFTTTGSTGYGLDRWATYNSGGTTYSVQTFTTGIASTIGYEATNYARLVTTGQTGTAAYTQFAQKVEDVKILAGKTVTISFWAKAVSGTPKVAVEFQQNFGTGGSPSASVETYAGQVTISTSWARYSLTVNVPSISGKTIGTTANTSFTQVSLWVSAGTDFNSRAGSIGIQSNTFDIWGVQVEKGSTATAFRCNAPSVQAELAACQRYYYRVTGASGIQLGSGIAFGSTGGFFNIPYAVTMRTTVSSIDTNGTFSYGNGVIAANFSSCTLESGAQGTRSAFLRLEGSSGMTSGMPYRLDGNSTAYIGFNAEL